MTLFNMSLSQSLSHEDLFHTPRRRSGIVIVSSRRRIVAFLTALRTNGGKFLRREITRAYVLTCIQKQATLVTKMISVLFLPRRRSSQRRTQPGMFSNGGIRTPQISTKSENIVMMIARARSAKSAKIVLLYN